MLGVDIKCEYLGLVVGAFRLASTGEDFVMEPAKKIPPETLHYFVQAAETRRKINSNADTLLVMIDSTSSR